MSKYFSEEGKIVQLSRRQKNIVSLAKNISFQSQHPTFFHGAVLVRGSIIINTACNTLDYSYFGNRFRNDGFKATRHAELSVILGIPRKNTTGSDIYVVRTNKDSMFCNSKPCMMCSNAMLYVGIKRVFFSDEKGFIRVIKLL